GSTATTRSRGEPSHHHSLQQFIT
ncbi:hypothetical protein AVDCRST_MAG94-2374, partial [uncultured Leptolyngbya sp.]